MRRSRDKATEEGAARDDVIEIPYDPVGEQVVLAAALVDQDTRRYLVQHGVRAEQFSVADHQLAWTHIVLPMLRGQLEYDPAAVQQLAAGKLEVQYLFDLVEARPEPPANLQFHVEQLAWDAARMTAVRGPLASLLAALKNPHTRPERVKALAKALGATLEEHEGRSYMLDSHALARTQADEIAERMLGRAVYPYGLPGIDFYEEGHKQSGEPRLVPGAKPGFVTVITGVSGHGKSTITARIALGLARQKRKVLYGAWEMTNGMTLELLAGMSLGYSRSAVMKGKLTPEEHRAMFSRMERIGDYVKFFDNPFMVERARSGKRTTYEHNLDIIERHIGDSGCDVFIADLWARCLVTDDPGDEAQALIAQQNMLQRMQVHGILCQQQNIEKIESRRDKWPTQSTTFGSKAWTFIADTMLGVNLPAMWKDVPANTAEVHVLKQRWGPYPLLVELEWDADRGAYGAGTSLAYPRSGGQMGEGSVFEAPRKGGRAR